MLKSVRNTECEKPPSIFIAEISRGGSLVQSFEAR